MQGHEFNEIGGEPAHHITRGALCAREIDPWVCVVVVPERVVVFLVTLEFVERPALALTEAIGSRERRHSERLIPDIFHTALDADDRTSTASDKRR